MSKESEESSMEPVSAGIVAGGSLLAGLLQARAAAAQRKREMEMQAMQQGAQSATQAAQAMTTGQQKAFEDMLAAFKGATS